MRDDLHSLVCSCTTHSPLWQPPTARYCIVSSIFVIVLFPSLRRFRHLISFHHALLQPQYLSHTSENRRASRMQEQPLLRRLQADGGTVRTPSGLRQRCRQWLLCSLNSAQRFMPYQQIPSAPSISTMSTHRRLSLVIDVAFPFRFRLRFGAFSESAT